MDDKRANLEDHLNNQTSRIAQGMEMAENLSYMIWGAAVTATRAFGSVTLNIDADNNRIYVSIKLRWWAKSKRLAKLHEAWLYRAEQRVLKQAPAGWKVLVFYDRKE